MKNNQLVYNTAELAELLEVSLPTLRQLLHSNNPPPFFRVGRCYKFPVSAIDSWLCDITSGGERDDR